MSPATATPSTARTILARCAARGIELRAEGEWLAWAGRAGAMGPELVEDIRAIKPQLLRALAAPLGPGLGPELQAQRWGPSLGHDRPAIHIDRPDPVAQAKALEWADQADGYARAEREALAQAGGHA